jgi:parallel beta-helix repeat protein
MNWYGIALEDSSNNTLSNNVVAENFAGIALEYGSNHNSLTNNSVNASVEGIKVYHDSNNNTLSNNTASGNSAGIILDSSSNNTLMNNTMSENRYSFGVLGDTLDHFIHHVDSTNTVNGKPVYYWVNQHDQQIPSDAGYVGVVNSTNITVKDVTSANNEQGVLFAYTSSSQIENANVLNNMAGIDLQNSTNNNITDNNASNNVDTGIELLYATLNNLSNNTASNNNYGIYLTDSDNNVIAGNIADLNEYSNIWLTSSSNDNIIVGNTANSSYRGILLDSSDNNRILGNTANSNTYYGIHLRSSNNNTIYNNYFNNTNNARDDGTNIWNITKTAGTNIVGGPYLGGNYWSDYVGSDNDKDGLGDTQIPYNSSNNIQNSGDYHPLVSASLYITSFAPSSPVTDTVCTWRSFNLTLDRTVNLSWYLDGTLLFTNESVREASCTLHAVVQGEHNVSALASNATGSLMQTWIWNVQAPPPAPLPIIGGALRAPPGVATIPTKPTGEVTSSVTAYSPDGKASVTIFEDTIAQDAAGKLLTQVTVSYPVALPAAVPSGVSYVGYAIELGPTGATFTQPVEIIITFDPTQFEGKTPVIYVYEAGEWKPLKTTVDGNKAIAEVDHFSIFVLFAERAAPLPTPTSVVTPVAPAVTPTPTPPPSPSVTAPPLQVVLVVIIALVVGMLIIASAYKMLRRRT